MVMSKLLSISGLSCEDPSFRNPLTETRIRTLLSIELCVEPFDLKMQVATPSPFKALAVQVYKCLTELFSWSINSDSFKSVVRVEPAFASRYLLSVSWVDNNVCSRPLPVIKIRTIRTNNKPLTLVINTNIN